MFDFHFFHFSRVFFPRFTHVTKKKGVREYAFLLFLVTRRLFFWCQHSDVCRSHVFFFVVPTVDETLLLMPEHGELLCPVPTYCQARAIRELCFMMEKFNFLAATLLSEK